MNQKAPRATDVGYKSSSESVTKTASETTTVALNLTQC